MIRSTRRPSPTPVSILPAAPAQLLVLRAMSAYRHAPVALAGVHFSTDPVVRIGALRVCRFTVGSRRYKRISFAGGRWEVYRIDPDGLESFIGHERSLVRRATGDSAYGGLQYVKAERAGGVA